MSSFEPGRSKSILEPRGAEEAAQKAGNLHLIWDNLFCQLLNILIVCLNLVSEESFRKEKELGSPHTNALEAAVCAACGQLHEKFGKFFRMQLCEYIVVVYGIADKLFAQAL